MLFSIIFQSTSKYFWIKIYKLGILGYLSKLEGVDTKRKVKYLWSVNFFPGSISFLQLFIKNGTFSGVQACDYYKSGTSFYWWPLESFFKWVRYYTHNDNIKFSFVSCAAFALSALYFTWSVATSNLHLPGIPTLCVTMEDPTGVPGTICSFGYKISCDTLKALTWNCSAIPSNKLLFTLIDGQSDRQQSTTSLIDNCSPSLMIWVCSWY